MVAARGSSTHDRRTRNSGINTGRCGELHFGPANTSSKPPGFTWRTVLRWTPGSPCHGCPVSLRFKVLSLIDHNHIEPAGNPVDCLAQWLVSVKRNNSCRSESATLAHLPTYSLIEQIPEFMHSVVSAPCQRTETTRAQSGWPAVLDGGYPFLSDIEVNPGAFAEAPPDKIFKQPVG